jgi:hypothetical protein
VATTVLAKSGKALRINKNTVANGRSGKLWPISRKAKEATSTVLTIEEEAALQATTLDLSR